MNPIRKYLNGWADARMFEGAFPADVSGECLYFAVDPADLTVALPAGRSARLVVLHEDGGASALRISLGEGAQLDLLEVFTGSTSAEVGLTQAAGSASRITTLQFAGAEAAYRTELNGARAETLLHSLFMVGGDEHCSVRLHTAHNVADCRSESHVKGVAGGSATGRFDGLVYVAPDAQHTDAVQQSRNVLLSDTARIDTLPQLEIYADDVKCSHGATVGRMDNEAILYMRQRGLSEDVARRLQIEGFAADTVRHCAIEPLHDALMELVAEKLELFR